MEVGTDWQMSWPMVRPSAALFLLRLGEVSTRIPPLDTFSHWGGVSGVPHSGLLTMELQNVSYLS